MEVLEIERAIADLRQAVQVSANADSGEHATAADYQMMINALEEILVEIEIPRPDIEKLASLLNEVQRIFRAIVHRTTEQLSAAAHNITTGAPIDGLFKSQAKVDATRSIIDELSKKIVAAANRRTAEINAATQLSAPSQPSSNPNKLPFSVEETAVHYAATALTKKSEAEKIDVTKLVTEVTRRLGRVIEAHPESKADYIPILQQMLKLSMHLITSNLGGDGEPPRGPVDTPGKRADDDGMEARITALEKDVAAIKVDVAVIKANGATKSDIADTKAAVSEAKTSIILWVAGVVILAQVLPAVLKLFPQ